MHDDFGGSFQFSAAWNSFSLTIQEVSKSHHHFLLLRCQKSIVHSFSLDTADSNKNLSIYLDTSSITFHFAKSPSPSIWLALHCTRCCLQPMHLVASNNQPTKRLFGFYARFVFNRHLQAIIKHLRAIITSKKYFMQHHHKQ